MTVYQIILISILIFEIVYFCIFKPLLDYFMSKKNKDKNTTINNVYTHLKDNEIDVFEDED